MFSDGTLHQELCPNNNVFRVLVLFVIFMGAASMFGGLAATPSTLAVLRVVAETDKV